MCREAVLDVLDRVTVDFRFVVQMTYNGSEALQGYQLDQEERAALLSGDIRWLDEHVGKLDGRMSTWPRCRLQQEIW